MRTLLAFVLVGLASSAAQSPPAASSHDWLVTDDPLVARGAKSDDGKRVTIENGCLSATWTLSPDAALVGIEVGTSKEQMVRAVQPMARVQIDGKDFAVGGLLGQRDRAFLLPEELATMTADPAAFRCVSFEFRPMQERFPWPQSARTRPIHGEVHWPPRGVHGVFGFRTPEGLDPSLRLEVHVEVYDGLPLVCQWFELHNGSHKAIELDRFTSLELACVEAESRVEPERRDVRLPEIHVETDFSFHAMTGTDGSAHCVRWLADAAFETQVNYEKQTRCLLEARPDLGPAQTIAPNGTFASFRTWLLFHGADADRDRRSLGLRRMYRTLAPWTRENPLMMHLRTSEPEAVRSAVEQCAEVGFELLILSFGSGFDIEDDSEANLRRWKELADYAHARSVQIGGYSLLSSRKIEPEGDNCIHPATGKPGGQIFGHAPALASEWGTRYFQKLRRFFEHTGFDCLEHDGSYPGDPDAASRPPLQKGLADSQWVQHRILADFYAWCRGRGVYLNVPDWYFLNGSNKTGMGYRETNWSLPRELQVLHARQNMFDGTLHKSSSMGWMFVPLTEYHGGGAAATIEPLAEHLDHYERMMSSTLGYGVQACWRGPRLYDGEATKQLVRARVAAFRSARAAWEGDVVHGSSRRADGRWLDWCLHASPGGGAPARVVVWNPTAAAITAELPLDLTFAGLRGTVEAVDGAGAAQARHALDAGNRMRLAVFVPAGSEAVYELRQGARR